MKRLFRIEYPSGLAIGYLRYLWYLWLQNENTAEPSWLGSQIDLSTTESDIRNLLQFSCLCLLLRCAPPKLGPNSGWSLWLCVRTIRISNWAHFPIFVCVVALCSSQIGAKLRILIPLGNWGRNKNRRKFSYPPFFLRWAWFVAKPTWIIPETGQESKFKSPSVRELHSGRNQLPGISSEPKFSKAAGICWRCWSKGRREIEFGDRQEM